jgi:hypothetical protein
VAPCGSANAVHGKSGGTCAGRGYSALENPRLGKGGGALVHDEAASELRDSIPSSELEAGFQPN